MNKLPIKNKDPFARRFSTLAFNRKAFTPICAWFSGFLMTFTLSHRAFARVEERSDLWAHAAVSYAISLTISEICYKKPLIFKPQSLEISLMAGMTTTILLGLAKEFIRDPRIGQGDLLADGLGTVTGGGMFIFLETPVAQF